MNLTKLSEQNKANYEKYLSRMTKSCNKSSKRFIPIYCNSRTLDVGCGSGVLLECLSNAKGIDLNENSIHVCHIKGLNAECKALQDVDEMFDTIIFSSVLHEFSSYDDKNPFSSKSILDALRTAYNKLYPGGYIIIRDGVKGSQNATSINVVNRDVIDDFLQYIDDAPMFDDESYGVRNNTITANSYLLKEFMYTYTWGKDSYYREVQEQFGILTKEQWKNIVVESGFKIDKFETYSEEYVKYLSKYFEVTDELVRLFKDAVVFIVARKI